MAHTEPVSGLSTSAVVKNKDYKFDSVNNRFIGVGVLAVNVINLNADYTFNTNTSQCYTTRITDTICMQTGIPITSRREPINNCLSDDGLTLVTTGFMHGDSSTLLDTQRLQYIKSISIMQAGSYGYPLTVNKDSSVGANISTYGPSEGYISLKNGTPFSKLDDVYIVTESVAYYGKVLADGSSITVTPPISTYASNTLISTVITGIPYTYTDKKLSGSVQGYPYSIDFVSSGLVISSGNRDSFGFTFYNDSNLYNKYLGVTLLVDGYFLYSTDSNYQIQSTSTYRSYLAAAINSGEEIKIYAGCSGGSGSNYITYEK